jgi:hypothetical protein
MTTINDPQSSTKHGMYAGWIRFGLIRYPTRSIFIGLGFSSNPYFHYQIQTEPTRLLTGWIGLGLRFVNKNFKKIIDRQKIHFLNFLKIHIIQFNTIVIHF